MQSFLFFFWAIFILIVMCAEDMSLLKVATSIAVLVDAVLFLFVIFDKFQYQELFLSTNSPNNNCALMQCL